MSDNDKSNLGSYVFVGCMFIGMAIGMFVDNTGAGTMLGMGVGFIGWYFASAKNKDSES